MESSTHIKYNTIGDEKVEMEVCDNPMECPECCYILNKRNEKVIDEIVSELEDLFPLDITRIEMNIFPSEKNIKYYSFDGIEELIKSLFQSEKSRVQKDLGISDIFLKVHFVKNPIYNIPTIRIEFIIPKKISDESLMMISNFLNHKLIFFIGSVGKVERIKIPHPLNLKKIFKIPMIMGLPMFVSEGLYKSMGFSESQLVEMNYLLGSTIFHLNNFELFIEKDPKPFREMRRLIKESISDIQLRNGITKTIRNLVLDGDEPNIRLEKGVIEDVKYMIKTEKEMNEKKGNEIVDILFDEDIESDDDNDLPF